MNIFGAGVIGEATLHACRQKGIHISRFVDHRIKGELLGVPIVTLNGIECPASFLLTSPNIQDMIGPVERMGGTWKSCGEVLCDFDISPYKFKPYSTEHVKYLIRTVLHHHENYLRPELLTVQSVDLVITEKCTMKCRDCANLMQYYANPENQELNEVLRSIDELSSKMDEIYEVRVIGGEPFVNKEIHLIVDKLTSNDKVKKVSIFTNGTVVPRETQWSALRHEKVRFFITDYDELSRNIRPLIKELDNHGINYVSEKANGWTECASLHHHKRSVSENEQIFSACCAKNLATLADGNLYRCPFAANAFKLQAVPNYREDYLVVAEVGREEIRRFLREKTYLKSCDHCAGRSYGDKVIEAAIQTKVPLKYKKFITLHDIEQIKVHGPEKILGDPDFILR